MSTRVMPVGGLTDEQVHSVLIAATAAPSLRNSQPWRFRCTPGAIELYADTTRAMPVADPTTGNCCWPAARPCSTCG